MADEILFALPETIQKQEYLLATYYIEVNRDTDILKKASAMAIGQTIGTWVEVPGITEKMREDHMGKVVNILEAPPYELSTQIEGDKRAYFIQIGYPAINFGAQFPMMFTTLLGNDASTSAQVKLVDLQLPAQFVSAFTGPKFGIAGIRKLAGVARGPLTLNMIKPCTGLTPDAGAKIFYDTALGGIDFIKDDELLGNTSFSPVAQRVKAYNKASEAAYQHTGKRTIYIPNVTDSAARILDTAKEAVDAGARAVMISFSAVGYSLFQFISEQIGVPVLGHYAVTGMSNEGLVSGLSSHLSIGKFPRLAGADMIMMNTPYGGYPLLRKSYLMSAQQMTLPYFSLKPSMPIAGGGVHPGMTEKLISDLGPDIVLASGGAIQGHPMGAKAGGIALRQAIDAAMEGISIREYAKDHAELATAIKQFGVYGE